MEKEAHNTEDQINVPGAADPTLAQLSEEKQTELAAFRKMIHEHTEWTPKQLTFLDDATLYRYLKARNWKADASRDMLLATMKWREEFKPDETTVDMVASCIQIGGMYIHGYDKYRRPVVYLKVADKPDPHTSEEKLRFITFTLEKAAKLMDKSRGVEKAVWCVDCNNYDRKYNGDLSHSRALLSILQNHYPERLGLFLIIDAPFLFRIFWKLISPFIDAKTMRKIVFLGGTPEEKRKVLQEYIDLKDVPKAYWGDSDFVFNADEYIAWLKEDEKEHKLEQKQNGDEGRNDKGKERVEGEE